MQQLPPAEDAEEHLMDRKPVRFTFDLPPDAYRLLRGVQERRRMAGRHASLRGLLLEAITARYAGRGE